MKSRIEKIIRDEGISTSKFADEIGVQRSGISHILSGRNNPSLELIQKILSRFRNINAEWLINGRGDAYKTGIKQQSFFTETEENTLQENLAEIKINEEIVSEPAEIKQNENSQMTVSQPIDSKKIDRIIVFYNDRSFSEYHPE